MRACRAQSESSNAHVLKPYTAHSSSVLPGQTDIFTLRLPPACTAIKVKMRRRGGDPLLMIRCGEEPPRVPRRSKVLADAWDQEAFDAGSAEHCVALALTSHSQPVHVGVCNYTAHRQEPCFYTITVETDQPAPHHDRSPSIVHSRTCANHFDGAASVASPRRAAAATPRAAEPAGRTHFTPLAPECRTPAKSAARTPPHPHGRPPLPHRSPPSQRPHPFHPPPPPRAPPPEGSGAEALLDAQLRAREVHVLRETVGRLERSVSSLDARRDAAVAAAARAAAARREGALVARVFVRWLRACVVRALHAEVEVLQARVELQQRRANEARRELEGARADVTKLVATLALREEQLEASRLDVRVAALASGDAESRAQAEVDLVSRELHSLDQLSAQAAATLNPTPVLAASFHPHTRRCHTSPAQIAEAIRHRRAARAEGGRRAREPSTPAHTPVASAGEGGSPRRDANASSTPHSPPSLPPLPLSSPTPSTPPMSDLASPDDLDQLYLSDGSAYSDERSTSASSHLGTGASTPFALKPTRHAERCAAALHRAAWPPAPRSPAHEPQRHYFTRASASPQSPPPRASLDVSPAASPRSSPPSEARRLHATGAASMASGFFLPPGAEPSVYGFGHHLERFDSLLASAPSMLDWHDAAAEARRPVMGSAARPGHRPRVTRGGCNLKEKFGRNVGGSGGAMQNSDLSYQFQGR
ncbi:hypothetical protein AB1Y20_003087 [Prymnesium parvum]|uniref:Centrosomal protein POC5 n=1 Tax=Prymnesium parvum TaxID=97485 RepID=A0AB34JC99_PRYPA